MTTSTTTTVIDHSSDAAFRTWGLEFSTQNAAVGLVQTADTGQINWVSVTRPGAGVAAGYEIWRFADSTIFMKLEYGTGNAAAGPQIWITVGTGSNGSGTITGQTSTRATFLSGTAPSSTVTTCISAWCAVADGYTVSWKEIYGGSSNANGGLLAVGKTTDGTGAATTTGFGVLKSAGSTAPVSLQSVRTISTATTFNDSQFCGLVPGSVVASTTASGNKQAYDFFLNVPDVIPFKWANVVLINEAARNTTFVVAQVGTTTHTYRATGQLGTTAGVNGTGTASVYGFGLFFE